MIRRGCQGLFPPTSLTTVTISCVLALLVATSVQAQSAAAAPGESNAPAGGAASPIFVRDADGKVVVRATRGSIQIDGQMTEEIYTRVPAITDFIQQEPSFGSPG